IAINQPRISRNEIAVLIVNIGGPLTFCKKGNIKLRSCVDVRLCYAEHQPNAGAAKYQHANKKDFKRGKEYRQHKRALLPALYEYLALLRFRLSVSVQHGFKLCIKAFRHLFYICVKCIFF